MENKDCHTKAALLLKYDHNQCMEPYHGKLYLQKRYFVTILAFIGWIFMYLLRTNLSISIVDMTSNRSITIGNKTVIEEAAFNWSSKEKGLILSAFSWGYLAAPLGIFGSRKYGGVTMFGTGVALTGLLTVLTPTVMSWNIYAYLLIRVMEGVMEGISACSTVEALRLWSAPSERNRIISGATAGHVVGTMLGYSVCGTIAYYMDWKAIFHITGGACLIWSLIWFTFVRNSPEHDNFITRAEKKYLQGFHQSSANTKVAIPWKQIFKSKAVWAYWNDRFAEAWSLSFLVYSLPIYIKDIHDVNIKSIGFISGLPHLCAIVSMIGGPFLADFLRNRSILSATNVHKLYLSFSQIISVVLLVLVALWKNFLFSIICFCLFRLLVTISTVSYGVLPVDMGGQHATIVMGGGITAVSVGLSLSPLVMGLIVTHHSEVEWSLYFLVISIFNLWAAFIFWRYGSGELQPWALPTEIVENTESHNLEEKN